MANMNLVTGYWGEEHVTSNDQGSFNAATLGSGEFVTERGNGFAASIISNNKIRVLDGDLMMQGRHIRIDEETYVDLYFDNGTQGYKRNDLIVARYTKDPTTDKESCTLVVIKGTPVEDSPVDPDYITGDILTEHALQNDMPLFRVPFDGLNIQPLVPLFETASSLNDVSVNVSSLNDDITRLDDDITELDNRTMRHVWSLSSRTSMLESNKCGIITTKAVPINVTIPANGAKYGARPVSDYITIQGYEPAFIAGVNTVNVDVVPYSVCLINNNLTLNWGFRNLSSKDQTISAGIYIAFTKIQQ